MKKLFYFFKKINMKKSSFNSNVKNDENNIQDNQNILDEMLNYYEKKIRKILI